MEEQIISTVKAMREAQREYYRTRDINVLRRSKALEKRVDTLIAEYENIDLNIESCKTPVIDQKGTFTEKIYNTVHVLVGCEQLNRCLTLTLMRIFLLAEGMGIDIEKHIQLKMEYNSSRPYKHGKKY